MDSGNALANRKHKTKLLVMVSFCKNEIDSYHELDSESVSLRNVLRHGVQRRPHQNCHDAGDGVEPFLF